MSKEKLYISFKEITTQEEKLKLVQVVDEGVKVLQEVQDLKESLKDTVGAVAEELDIKASVINKAIRIAYKKNLGEQKNNLSEVEDLLASIGRRV